MKITNLGVTNAGIASGTPVEDSASAAAGQAASNLTAGAKGYSPSPELRQLIQLALQQPEIREDRVQAAVQRLQQGFYHTPAGAEQTAAAMLHALD